jgi:hypothetical protein
MTSRMAAPDALGDLRKQVAATQRGDSSRHSLLDACQNIRVCSSEMTHKDSREEWHKVGAGDDV